MKRSEQEVFYGEEWSIRAEYSESPDTVENVYGKTVSTGKKTVRITITLNHKTQEFVLVNKELSVYDFTSGATLFEEAKSEVVSLLRSLSEIGEFTRTQSTKYIEEASDSFGYESNKDDDDDDDIGYDPSGFPFFSKDILDRLSNVSSQLIPNFDKSEFDQNANDMIESLGDMLNNEQPKGTKIKFGKGFDGKVVDILKKRREDYDSNK